MFNASKTKMYGFKKENYISVSFKVTDTKKKHSVKKKTMHSPSANKNSVKNVDVNNLFSDVWTKKISNSVKK